MMTIVMAQQGWQCPKCGNIISPNMIWCPFCSGEKKVTYTTTTSTPYKVDISSICKDEPQTIRCPKCGRSDYIREFGKDFSVTAEEAGFKYKCINCNTYIEPQSDRKTENSSEIPNSCKDEPQTDCQWK